MRTVAGIGRILLALVQCWLVLGLLLRVSGWRDSVHATQLLYYTTPWLVLAGGFSALALWFRSRTRRWRWVYALLAAGCLAGWLSVDWRWRSDGAPTRHARVVLWNVGRPAGRFPAVVRYLRAQEADIIAVAEWQPRRGGSSEKWRRAFPEYRLHFLPGDMLLLARGNIAPVQSGTLAPGSFFGISDATVGGRTYRILQADIYARPLVNREPPLRRLTELARENVGHGTLVLGDFNTPSDSRHLDPLRERFRLAFGHAGRGYASTWPIPLPVLQLDQVWAGPQLEVVRCRHGVTVLSDHRPVIVDLRWR